VMLPFFTELPLIRRSENTPEPLPLHDPPRMVA
jgi:hypothetical protein